MSDTAAQVVLVSVAIVAVQAVGGIVLARTLGPGDRGALAALVLWSSLAADLAAAGTPGAVAYRAASRNPGVGLRYVSRVLPILALVGLAMYGLVVALSGRLDSLPSLAVFVFALWVVVQLAHLPVVRFQQGRGKMGLFNGLRVIAEIGPTIGFVLFAVIGLLTVTTGGLSILLSVTLATAVGVLLANKIHGGDDDGSKSDSDRRRFWRYAGGSWLSVLAHRTNRTIDLLLLTLVVSSTADIGLYAVASTAALVLAVLGGSLGLDLFPRVAAMGSGETARPLIGRYLGFVAGISLAAAGIFFVVAGWLVPFVYGEQFAGSVGPTRILVFGAVALAVARVSGDALSGLGHPGRVAAAEVVGAAVTMLAILVVGTDSLIQVAGAAVAGYVATMVIVLILLTTSSPRMVA